MKPITVYEYSRLYKKDIGDKVYNALVNFFGDDKNDKFPYYSLIKDGIRFKQYVGVLCVGDQIIEVLPKADKSKNDDNSDNWRDCLVHMLRRVYKLDVKSPSKAPQKLTSSAILDIFIYQFLNEVDTLLNRGLVKCYHREEKNLFALKGKLLWNQHLSKNVIHKERFYVNYTSYDYEHILNRILRQALEIIPKIAGNPSLKGRAASTLFNFPELKRLQVTKDLFMNISFDRKTEDYKHAIEIAKLLLLRYMPDTRHGKTNILALMFDMNKLWEEFIFRVLKKQLQNYAVRDQVPKQYWFSNKHHKTVRPDIVISEGQRIKAIIDTKWKCPDYDKEVGSIAPTDSDLHQMFVYAKVFQTKQVALAYPESNNCSEIKGVFRDAYWGTDCDLIFLPCGTISSDWEKKIGEVVKNWLWTRFLYVLP